MRKPTTESSPYIRLLSAAMALRSNCRKRGSKSGFCRCCQFYSAGSLPHCRLNANPPSEWKFEEEEEKNDENTQSKGV